MGRISRCSQGVKGFQLGDLRTSVMLFVHDVFTIEERGEQEIDRRIGATAAVMQTLYRYMVKRELNMKEKLVIYQLMKPKLTHGHKLWVLTKRTRLGIESGEISFLQSVAGVSIGEEFSHPRETQIRAATPPHRKEPVEVARVSDKDASWMPYG